MTKKNKHKAKSKLKANNIDFLLQLSQRLEEGEEIQDIIEMSKRAKLCSKQGLSNASIATRLESENHPKSAPKNVPNNASNAFLKNPPPPSGSQDFDPITHAGSPLENDLFLSDDGMDTDGFIEPSSRKYKRRRSHINSSSSSGSSSDEDEASHSQRNTKKPRPGTPSPSKTAQMIRPLMTLQTTTTTKETTSQPTVSQKQKVKPLFLELHKADYPLTLVARALQQYISSSRTTPAGSVLLYPSNSDNRAKLISLNDPNFSLRETKGSQTQHAKTNKTQGPKPQGPNLYAVARNVNLSLSNQDISEALNLEATRLISAATSKPTYSVKIKFDTEEAKMAAIDKGIKIAFKTHKVVDYVTNRPLQCFKCQEFNHTAVHCTNTEKCKHCSGEHKHTVCPSKESPKKCANCGDQHPATYAGCPKYHEARIQQTAKQVTWAQKVAAPPTQIQTLRLAYSISYGIFQSLNKAMPGMISQNEIISHVSEGVSRAFRTHVLPQHVSTLQQHNNTK